MEKTNVFGVVLAGGIGSRMGNVEKPKQFMEVGKKPIIIHTIEKFVVQPQFERIIVLSPKAWLNYTKDVIRKYIREKDMIDVIPKMGRPAPRKVRNEPINKSGKGCPYCYNCVYKTQRCEEEIPDIREIEPEHFVRCWNV